MAKPNLNQRIRAQIDEIKDVADRFPGVTLIHRLPEFSVEYMSLKGLQLLGLTLEEVCNMTAMEYYERFFNMDDWNDYTPKMRGFMEQNKDHSISHFQQVKLAGNTDWTWHLSITRILMRDDDNLPLLTITTSYPVEGIMHVTTKVERLLNENTFLRKNYHQFSKLTKRERDILRLQVLGNSSQEIADQLFISVATAETHRRNVKKKLKATSSFELAEYARAFDLI
jgi:DNA-binding CsgD family transcriptional regulator